jgi:hypothetical protein
VTSPSASPKPLGPVLVHRQKLPGPAPPHPPPKGAVCAMSYPIALLSDPPAPTYPEYVELFEAARRTAPRFVDPANLYVGAAAAQRRGADMFTMGLLQEGELR